MNFELISSDEFRKYADQSPYRSFTQTPEIAKYRESEGWTIYYFAVKEKEKILAAAAAFAKPTFLGKSIYVVPGGPLLDLEDTKLTNFFFKHLISFAKTHNGYALQISPYYELIERDRNGEVVENGFHHEKAVKNLERFKFKLCSDASQPRYLFVLDLNNRNAEELFSDFKRNTRNHIRKAEKQGVTIRELQKSELNYFKDITESTSLRRNFSDRPLSYYEKIYDLFHDRDEVKFILAEAEIDGKKTPLSAAMFMLYGNEIIYLFSGSDQKYMRDYNAQYLIQWHMIKYAAEHHFKCYNFYGIQGLPDPSSKDYGIYDFKKGFGGRVVELIGTYELPLNTFYYLHEFLSKFKKH
ncbi:peptidoglycan bridge formation glycyltransferase FemA/FemB family protein [Candidatus Saccharibacteria bacterium]|nr:peptidoglycan bridge formation glycyltransferase FemA/FemB family protein [Candidatus Saccharibacteria bacterium]